MLSLIITAYIRIFPFLNICLWATMNNMAFIIKLYHKNLCCFIVFLVVSFNEDLEHFENVFKNKKKSWEN